MKTYELWHTPSGNAMSEHRSLEVALDSVRELLDLDGDPAVRSMALLSVDRRGRTKLVAEGADLVAMAREKIPQR